MSSGAQAPLTLENFTFQSGYIQIKGEMQTGQIYINFTFQSGYIQIITTLGKVVDIMSLHSNLVIFKFFRSTNSNCSICLYIPIWLYSNFGRLNSEHNLETALHSNLVIFK